MLGAMETREPETGDGPDGASPGWDAITQALRKIYGDTEPRHLAPILPAMLGGNDPLDGISAFKSSFGGREHWHLVTYGYSELYAKETDDAEVSGYGFEMTLRVIDPESPDSVPMWAVSFLQNLARYVFRTGNAFASGHHTTLNGPIALGRDTALEAAAFLPDPELPPIETPNGKVEFLQVVGLTQDEYDATKAWDTVKLLGVLAEHDRALVTDLPRKSWLGRPEIRALVEAGAARDGSSMGMFFTTRGSLDAAATPPVLGVAANGLDDLKRMIRARLAFGRPAILCWPKGGVELTAGETTQLCEDAEGTTLVLDVQDRAAILEIPVRRGDYPLPSGKAALRVIPIEILDGEGKRVMKTIG
jgi:suppressor of fused